jgi:hypothetical protein
VRNAAKALIAAKVRLPKVLNELGELTATMLSEPESQPIKRRKIWYWPLSISLLNLRIAPFDSLFCRQRRTLKPMNMPEEYRAQAQRCRDMADQVLSPLDKEMWLGLAADWLSMASIHERFGSHSP